MSIRNLGFVQRRDEIPLAHLIHANGRQNSQRFQFLLLAFAQLDANVGQNNQLANNLNIRITRLSCSQVKTCFVVVLI